MGGATAFGGDETKVVREEVFDEPVAIEKVFFVVVEVEIPLLLETVLETRMGVEGGVKGTEAKGAFAFTEDFGLAKGALKAEDGEAAKVNAAAEEEETETTDMIVVQPKNLKSSKKFRKKV